MVRMWEWMMERDEDVAVARTPLSALQDDDLVALTVPPTPSPLAESEDDGTSTVGPPSATSKPEYDDDGTSTVALTYKHEHDDGASPATITAAPAMNLVLSPGTTDASCRTGACEFWDLGQGEFLCVRCGEIEGRVLLVGDGLVAPMGSV